jgi:TPR repeat protein
MLAAQTLAEQDFANAASCYRRAAEQGDREAQDALSRLLFEAEYLPPDYAEARRWAEAASAQGVASAEARLSMVYHNALGVDRNPALAAYWWQRAARKGEPDAQAMLGAHLIGAAVARDPVIALARLIRAMRGGSQLAGPILPKARAELTPEQTAEAEHLACAPLDADAAV